VEREIHDGTEHKHGKFMWRMEKKSFCAFPRGAGKFLHIVAHSVTDRMKNLVLIQFVNGYLGQFEFKESFNVNILECETYWRNYTRFN
jgi:hypothetical protein